MYVCYFLQRSWLLVESCLSLLTQCSINTSESNIPLLQRSCCESVSEVAQHNDHSLCWRCVSFFDAVGAIQRFPVKSADLVVTWAGWLSNCYREGEEFYIRIPPGFRGTAGALFWTFWLVCSSNKLKCVLCQNLHKHIDLLRNLTENGNAYTKEYVKQVLEDLDRHRCENRCDRNYIKCILPRSCQKQQLQISFCA